MSMPSDGDTTTTYEGRFSDGKSAGAANVTVRFCDRGLEIDIPDQSEPLVWPYGALRTSEPLSPHAIDAAVTYTYQEGATLFVPGALFARKLASVAPHLTTRAQRWRHARPWIIAAAIAILIGTFAWAGGFSPANTVARALPDKLRHVMGSHVVSSMSQGHKTCNDTAGRAALDQMIERLVRASGSDKTFKVVVVDWDLLNAFATPGERIVVTSKLIETADSPDELAGVIAHEMGHGIRLHPETGLVRAIGLTAIVELMVGGGGGSLASLGTALAQLSYSRAAEQQADDEAIRILRNSQISINGLEAFFKRISGRKKEKNSDAGDRQETKVEEPKNSWGSPFDLLRSHPPTRDRMARLQQQPNYVSSPALTGAEWTALKGVCNSHQKDKQ